MVTMWVAETALKWADQKVMIWVVPKAVTMADKLDLH